MDESSLTVVPAGILEDESGYPFTGLQAPPWITGLDAFFAGQPIRSIADGPFRTCANLCRRIGDLDLYRQWLRNALAGNHSPWWCAAFATSMLVGYFSTGKSLLDAGAVALNLLYGLKLSPGDQDFRKEKFWNVLKASDQAAHDTLRPHKPFVDEAVKWRDQAVHRLAPRVRVLNDGPPTKPPEHTTLNDVRLGMVDSPEVDMVEVFLGKKPQWREPLEFVDGFSVRFHAFATDLAQVIMQKLQKDRKALVSRAG